MYIGEFRGQKVAVKQLVSDKVDDENLKRFQSEIELMAQLHHPNIVQMIAASWEPPHLAIILELCSQGDLKRALRRGRKKLDYSARLAWITQTVQGMNYLHCQKEPIMHRDLKPENCLITEFQQLKISDFGESRAKRADDDKMTVVGECRHRLFTHVCGPLAAG